MKSIIIIVTFILFLPLVIQAQAITKDKGKKSNPGITKKHKAVKLQPMPTRHFFCKEVKKPVKRTK